MKLLLVNTLIFVSTAVTLAQSHPSTRVEIIINRDGTDLKGIFYVSGDSGILPTVVLLHGFPGNETDVLDLGKRLSKFGYNTFTFNYSGTHHSEGEFNFENSQNDIEAAFAFLYQPETLKKFRIDTTRIILGGYSFGGGMALTYAANHPTIMEVFSIAGNDHGAAIREYQLNPERRRMLDDIFNELKNRTEFVRFGPGGTPDEMVKMKLIDSNPSYDLIYCAPLLASRDILLIGGWDDHNVSIEDRILPLYRALITAKAQKVRIRAVQDNHSFRNSREELARIIMDWLVSNKSENPYR
jgi:pimeloyl-ACP methyl ester carboxylesterase